ncbi:HlyC/CorC family transporter [Rhodobacteraceae bacterium 2376]|uniref:HlyC/CorC family transporter n=1 Tax=Rhabdonatronobacter sediminivivens TaxID=2743469 RepID=A0A7Z0HYK0_9RHOB|nr:hemolysin family protein [Rhabdonatronobacter sediminivivens]NYS24422.1 HlyC/CorC family transporter [Rhabdonatronobacter sediminivivens]
MGDTTDGSSAAQGALEDPREAEQRGFFGRLFGALTPEDEDDDTAGTMLKGALPGLANLRKLRVDDVSIPKAEIAAVPLDVARDELVRVFRESGFSRLPVYLDTLDRPLGMLHLKDLALTYGFNGNSHDIDLEPLLRPVLFVPPSMPLAVLLQKMQSERRHMALVIDEFGGVDGLLTIEDLVEQVVGEIEDEHDTDEEAPFTQERPGIWLAEARTPLEEFESEIGMKLAEAEDTEEVDTLGGLVFMLAERVPARSEVIDHPDGVSFEVIDADARRIKRLRVRLPSAQAAS